MRFVSALLVCVTWVGGGGGGGGGGFVFQAEDGIRDLVRSRGLGDVYKRQITASITSQTYYNILFCYSDRA